MIIICPFCEKHIDLNKLGIHFRKKHKGRKIPDLKTIKPAKPPTKSIEFKAKNSIPRLKVIKNYKNSSLNKVYTLEDLKKDNIKKAHNSFYIKK